MLRTISPQEMKRVESRVIAERGVTGEELMERAAGHVAAAAARRVAGNPGRVLCICGTGNNGGDGMAAMRLLRARDSRRPISLWLLEGALSPDASLQRRRLEEEAPDIALQLIREGNGLPALPADTACAVDAIFGTGLSRQVAGAAADLCRLMEQIDRRGIPVVAVDIPSGLHGETGEVMGAAVRAVETVTFHRPKTGLFLGAGPDLAGRMTVASIGIKPEWDDAAGFRVAEEEDIPAWFPPRLRDCHKGSFGRVLVLAGSRGMAGAAAICALAALRTGAGLVRVACAEEIADVIQQLCPCATCVPLPAGGAAEKPLADACAWADALAMGPGLGTGFHSSAWVSRALESLRDEGPKPAVLDADALNILARNSQSHGAALSPRHVLTPHPAEAARLMGVPVQSVLTDPPGTARALQARYGASIVLKGASSVLISGRREGINVLGSPGMAKGGSGDALTGVLAALLAMQCAAAGPNGLDVFQAIQAGTALHGLAGRAAAAVFGERGMLATDLCDRLGLAASRLCGS
ncbi:MAG: NAD(P)H-hydrate dehydratase [Clostridia bacterium]|nr:NAD(P)H-hydrate dehydratase [Clostridia bacterium]